MPFTFAIKDTYRQSVEIASGGRQTALYDDKGIPSIMNVIPRLTYKDVGISDSTATLPAFVIDDEYVDELFIGAYPACTHDERAYSLPGQVPDDSADHDEAVAYCRAKGDGWHCMTNAEYAAIALWCKKNGFYPRGNNNHCSDFSAPHEKCRIGSVNVSSSGREIELGLTGTGPASWTHDGTPNGIYGLNGDVWEWSTGVRTVYGEIQILGGNSASLPTADFAVGSTQWKGILQNGTLVAPGTAGTLKYAVTSDKVTISTTVPETSSNSFKRFKNIVAGSGILIPDILKGLALYPSDASEHNDVFYLNHLNAELCFTRGGNYDTAYGAGGVFALYGQQRSEFSGVGYRVAFVGAKRTSH